MPNPFAGQVQEGMAPPDLSWHYDYAALMNEFSRRIEQLEEFDPRNEGAEDLSDYLDCLHTLLSFRPHTRVDIEKAARDNVGGNTKKRKKVKSSDAVG